MGEQALFPTMDDLIGELERLRADLHAHERGEVIVRLREENEELKGWVVERPDSEGKEQDAELQRLREENGMLRTEQGVDAYIGAERAEVARLHRIEEAAKALLNPG